MHRCGSAHSGRRRSAWTLILSGLAAAAIGFAVVGDAQAIDRPADARNRAAKNAAKAAPRIAPRPKALTKSNPAVVNPNRAGVQPNPGLPRGAVGNPGSNDPRHTGAVDEQSATAARGDRSAWPSQCVDGPSQSSECRDRSGQPAQRRSRST